ncbi:TetR/AcrR family transcriptional regulator [Dactylosporangium sp. NPDC049525]|uniref:TetR/AcrR family transcriptional regulator n=1 Tax=Dactylosporangium sp. NPDC049525 TaxID=3154730 RepID=UPI003447EE9C
MPNDTRNRMVEAAVGALRRNGVAGMSFTEILTASGAARGAIYHHFPGGKTQLVAEAAALNGREVRARLEHLPGTDPRQVVEDFLALVRPVVIESSTGSGCAVAAVAVGYDAATDQIPHEASAAAFASWVDALADRLTSAGLDRDDAGDLATTLITLLEGAHVLCRAAGSVEPFDRVCRTAKTLLDGRYPG